MNYNVISILAAPLLAARKVEAMVKARTNRRMTQEVFFKLEGDNQIYSSYGGIYYRKDIRTQSKEAQRAWCRLTGVTREAMDAAVTAYQANSENEARLEATQEILNIANRHGLHVQVDYIGEPVTIDCKTLEPV